MRAFITVRDNPSYPIKEIRQGCASAGYIVQSLSRLDAIDTKNDIVITWTPWKGSLHHDMGERHRALGGRWIVFENGYLSPTDGTPTYTAGLGGFNGWGDERRRPDADRLTMFGLKVAERVRNPNGYILVVGQFGHADTRYSMPTGWPDDIVRELRGLTARPIVYRKKEGRQRQPSPGQGVTVTDEALDVLIRGAHCVVTWNSKAAMKAVLMGIPAISVAERSASAQICAGNLDLIDDPFWPERHQRESFFRSIVSACYTPKEIAAGDPIRRLA